MPDKAVLTSPIECCPRSCEVAWRYGEGPSEFQAIVEAVPNIVWVTDADAQALFVNRRGVDYTGLPLEEFKGTGWLSVIHPEDVGGASEAWRAAIAVSSPCEMKYRVRDRDGTYRWMLARGNPIEAPVGEALWWVGSWTDVDDYERMAEDRRRYEAFRSTVLDNMAEGLFTLDRDGCVTFVNPAAGELLGYRPSELMGRRSHGLIHHESSDGSSVDEEECSLLEVRLSGRPVRRAHDVFTRRDGSTIPVTYSAAPLTLDAEAAGVVVVFHDALQEEAQQARVRRELDVLAWVGRIREAIDEDRLVLYSQPILAQRGGRDSEELLLRMRARGGEIIRPGCFIPTAEQYGMIGEIDRWVVGRAVDLAAAGRRVEVNVSAQSIANGDLLALIKRGLLTTGADPSNLIVELTETALLEDLRAGETFSHGLAQLGCGFALDDFGTGYASLTYLKRLPLTYLKIDIDFVLDLPKNTANQHLVKAIVNLARSFGIETIAEGVEDPETLELLRHYGVDYAQGFLLGQPAPLRPALPAGVAR